MHRTKALAGLLCLFAAFPAFGQALMVQPIDTSNLATKTEVQTAQTAATAAQSSANSKVSSVNTQTGTVTLSIPSAYTDAQALAAASAMTAFTSANIAMPNGANIAHTIYQARNAVTISGTSATTVFSGTGDGNLTIQPVAMFVGARFHLVIAGRGQTGALNVAAITACVKLGAVSLICGTTAALPVSTAAIPFSADVVCTVRSTGASGTMSCVGAMGYVVGLSSGSALWTDLSTTSVVTIDTTAARAWDVTAQLSSAVGSPSLTVYDAFNMQEN